MPDPIRVLYVDDDDNSLEVRATILGKYGLDVVTETTVTDAERRLEEGDVDCVLSDLEMPDRDGFDLLEHVRETDPGLAFIMFTSHESDDLIQRALDSGATDYFPKSLTNVSYRLLAHRIEQAVETTGSRREAATEPDADAPVDEAPVSPEGLDPNGGGEPVSHDSLEGFDPRPGDSVLLECPQRDSRRDDACFDLLGLEEPDGRNVLLIRYREMKPDRLRRIVEDAADVRLVTIGYRQSVPDDIADRVERTQIKNPGELTRLGIVVTRAIGDWDDERDALVCLDSVDVLMRYTSGRKVFRFMQILLSKLRSSGAIAHFHVEPATADDRDLNTLKPLFDTVVTIGDDGVRIE